jgi:internalin A
MLTNQELLQLLEQAAIDKVTKLDLSRKDLTELPPEIGQLTNLTELNLYNNKLTELPPEIGQLTNLTELDVSLNQLTELPPEIGELTKLRKLDLKLNRLSLLPLEIGKLIYLTYINLRDNRLIPTIPPEILQKTHEPGAIIQYYFQLQTGNKKALNEAKMLLVGQGSVGKTSLMKRLVENNYDPHEGKTDGINIQSWLIEVNRQDIRLNIWDFGGQEIMHATHQFFLTKRSLYLLVVDTRLDEEENRIEYWLKIIQSFGGDSPVIIIGNKIDQQPLHIDGRGLQSKYKNVKAIVETSCQTLEGIDKLKQVITRQVGALEHIHDQLPLSWFTLKDKLEHIQRDYISYNDYQRMCSRVGISNEHSQNTLIRFLHDLGIVLNFQDDPRLEDTNILNPRWVTTAVYKILNNNKLMTQYKGILKRDMLETILAPETYPRQKHLFIIDMMRKFELCFDLESFTNEEFLIPDLLTKEEPYTGDWNEALAFEYHYNVLPSSIISRFIVRMNDKILGKTYWRSGVVLEYEDNKALVKADREDKKIFIWVSGKEQTRRIFLTVIRSQFDGIHKTIPGIEATPKVPIPNHPKIVVDYKHLLTLEKKNKLSFIPEGLDREVNVEQLLNGIELEPKRHQKLSNCTNNDITEIAKLLASRAPNIINNLNQTTQGKFMNNSTDQSRRIENKDGILSNITLGDIGDNSGTIGGTVTQSINELPASSEPGKPGIKELLEQLQTAIKEEPSLSEEEKVDALEQVEALAQAAKNPGDGDMKKLAKNATRTLKGIISEAPNVVRFAQACQEVLPVVAKFFAF